MSLYSHTTRASGLVLTASIYNTDHQLHADSNTLALVEDISSDVTAMRATVDPYPAGVASLATTAAGELQRIRYQLDLIIGGTYWYEVPTSGSSFKVHRNGVNQTGIANGVYTKVRFTHKDFDTNSDFAEDADDSGGAAENRFIPTIEGKYFLTASLMIQSLSADQTVKIIIYKNNAAILETFDWNRSGASGSISTNVSTIIDANGTGDYYEVFVRHGTGGTEVVDGGIIYTRFQGFGIGG